MSDTSSARSDEFLKISDQFRLGTLVTEAEHPVTSQLSELAKQDLPGAVRLLFQADTDVLNKFREFASSGQAAHLSHSISAAIKNGGRVFFVGCGSTGRLSLLLESIWRDYWRQEANPELERRVIGLMAGGDYALIRAVEGFEDHAGFGRKQLNDAGARTGDVVFALTEGGETPFVIGAAWTGLAVGAKVYFVYNNPDDVLAAAAERSREVLAEPAIEKINLTTGPMSIAGSTRMQATSIQLCVLLTVLEMAVRELAGQEATDIPHTFLVALEELFRELQTPECCAGLANLAALEASVYRARGRNSYFADRFSLDVLTDTAERSPTFSTPPFRKFDEEKAAESWSFLFVPENWTDNAWANVLKRPPRCLAWTENDMRSLVPPEQLEALRDNLQKIGPTELMRYKIGSNGIKYRPLVVKDSAMAIVSAVEREAARKFQAEQLAQFQAGHVHTGLIYFGASQPEGIFPGVANRLLVRVPATSLLLDGVTRVAVKLVMNALSTATMAQLGRIQGNVMFWVMPSNNKLIDRATRYIVQASGLDYAAANQLLFDVLEYVEPRRRMDKAFPPVVGLALTRLKFSLPNEQAEKYLLSHGLPAGPA